MVSIIDYDAGNVRSVENILRVMGQEYRITSSAEEILSADHIILPGVGAFGDAMEKLTSRGLVEVIHEAARRNIPFLGICLGQQLLFEEKITAGHARAILSIPSKEGRLTLTKKLLDEKLSVREAEAIARLLKCKERGDNKELLCLLSRHRAELLDDVHRCQKRIDCLDYLVYQLKKKNE